MDGSESEDTAIYTDDFYTLMKAPTVDGWWLAFEEGKYSRRIQPRNIIAVEEVLIENGKNIPFALKRWTTLQSKNLTDVSVYTHIPPIELFAFDYEELKVAVEAEQESEISDAAQEDIS
jgi:hypothetical protein